MSDHRILNVRWSVESLVIVREAEVGRTNAHWRISRFNLGPQLKFLVICFRNYRRTWSRCRIEIRDGVRKNVDEELITLNSRPLLHSRKKSWLEFY